MAAQLVVRCVHGLEWIVAAEVEAALPGASAITMSRREVTFRLPQLDAGVVSLRCADDAFLRVGQVSQVGRTKADLPSLANDVAQLDWHTAAEALRALRGACSTFDCVVSIEGKHSYNRYAVEDVVGRALAGVLGLRFLSRSPAKPAPTLRPDLTVRLFLRGTVLTAALRIGQRPLHRRSYKLDTGPGTLHPPLAAALAAIGGSDGLAVHDPFCGDGTVAIEYALRWPTSRVTAGDIEPERGANARANAHRAGVDVSVSAADAADIRTLGTRLDLLVTNPPWDLAVTSRGQLRSSLSTFWSDVTAAVRASGRLCVVTNALLDVPKELREHGFAVGLATQLRLAGRIAHVSLAGPPGSTTPRLPSGLALWRRRAMSAGVVTEHGF